MCLSVMILKDIILYLITSMMKGMFKGWVESVGVFCMYPCFWEEWWTGRDHFLVLVSVWGTTSSSVSLLVNSGKYQLITLCSISGSCVFCLPGWGGVGQTQALGKYTPLLLGRVSFCLEPKWTPIHQLGTIATLSLQHHISPMVICAVHAPVIAHM